jgi:hypothetical protein
LGLAEDREDHAKSRHILRISRRGWAGKNDRLGITDPDVFKTTVLGGRSKTITFEVPGHETEAALMTNITIMAGGKKLYDALTESGASARRASTSIRDPIAFDRNRRRRSRKSARC